MKTHDLIITTYNSYKYLKNIYYFIKNNRSIYTNIICVDDSSDNSFFVKLKDNLKEFEGVKILRNKYNLGPSGSRNVGIKFSSSEYISFHDPDDYVMNRRGEYINKIISEYSPNILFHDFTLIDLPRKMKFSNEFEIHNGFFYLFKSIYVTPAFTCKREILLNENCYDPKLRYAEDLDLYIRLKNKYKFFFVKDKLVKITNRKDRKFDPNHLSSNSFLMRKSINSILIKNIFKFRIESIIFLFAFFVNIFKGLFEIVFL